jgi:hypothetical protein
MALLGAPYIYIYDISRLRVKDNMKHYYSAEDQGNESQDWENLIYCSIPSTYVGPNPTGLARVTTTRNVRERNIMAG